MVSTRRPLPASNLEPLSPVQVHARFPDLKCSFTHILESKTSDEKEGHSSAGSAKHEPAGSHDQEMMERLFGRERQLFATLEVTSVWPLKLKKSDIINLTPRERAFYEKFIKKSPYELKEIALATKQQAFEKRWHLERRLRVTSSQAHRIKTSMCDFDALAVKLAKPQPSTSAASTYGKELLVTCYATIMYQQYTPEACAVATLAEAGVSLGQSTREACALATTAEARR
ncbi:hypothetical protein MTO96_043250 [Rhipicephalus appendiculatus]